MQIDDPIHQIEANEADGKYDARVFVDIRGRNTQQFVDILQNTTKELQDFL